MKGTEGVFAIGDCSTIEQEMMVKKSEELFQEADVNGDGTLTLDEFHKMLDKAKHLYPQVQVQLSYMENNIDKWVTLSSLSTWKITCMLLLQCACVWLVF